MKVENNHANRIAQKQAENSSAVDKTSRPAEQGARAGSLSGKDNASFSERARLLARAHTALEETPEVRRERVDRIKEQVQTGNYEIPIEALARQMQNRLKDL